MLFRSDLCLWRLRWVLGLHRQLTPNWWSRALTHSLTHSLTHWLTHSLTHSLIHSLTHWLTHWLTHSLTLTHSQLMKPCTHSLTHSLTHTLTHSHTHSLTHSFTHSLTHSPTSHCWWSRALTHSHTHSLPGIDCMSEVAAVHFTARVTSPLTHSLTHKGRDNSLHIQETQECHSEVAATRNLNTQTLLLQKKYYINKRFVTLPLLLPHLLHVWHDSTLTHSLTHSLSSFISKRN
jgi:hypothetical protein